MWSSVRWNVITVGFVCALHSVSLLLHLPCLLVCLSSNSWAHMWNLCNHPGSVAGMRNVMERISCLRCAVQLPVITQCTARQCFPLHMMSPPFPLIFPVNCINYNSVSYVKRWYWKVQAWSGFRSLSKCKLPPCRQHNSHESIVGFSLPSICLCVFVSSKSPTLSYVRTKTQHCFCVAASLGQSVKCSLFFLLSVRFLVRSQPRHTRGFQFTFISSEEKLRKQSKGNSRKCLTGVCADQWICSA